MVGAPLSSLRKAEFPSPKSVLMRSEIHLAAPKFDAFHLEKKTLFGTRFEAKFDLATRPDHPLPWN